MVAAVLLVLLITVLGAQVVGVGHPGRRLRQASSELSNRRHAGPGTGGGSTGRNAFLAAIVVGGVLRLLWVIWATRAPTEPADPAEYLRIASELGHGILPRFGGLDHSAYWPPGYPAVLAPFVFVADRTSWISPAFTASLVNTVAGTLTIWLTGLLAIRWIGAGARNTAAWLVALCPGLIYFTATAHTETVFTAMLLGVIVLCGAAATRSRARTWAGVGLLLGAAFLVRTPAVIALAAPALAIRAYSGSWRGAAQATGLVAIGAAVLLVPWMVRNGVQVGVWTPASTNNAAAACFGHHDGVDADWETSLGSPDLQAACFRDSPYDDRRLLALYDASGDVPAGVTVGEPDEPRWYRETMTDAVGWALSHPADEARLSVQKAWATWGDDGRVVDSARNYAEPGWAGRWQSGLGAIANLWTWIVGSLALLGLLLVPACRLALPVWAPVAFLTLAIAGGVAEPHYRNPVVPLVAILASGLLCRHSLRELE